MRIWLWKLEILVWRDDECIHNSYHTRIFLLSAGPNNHCEQKENIPKTTHKDANKRTVQTIAYLLVQILLAANISHSKTLNLTSRKHGPRQQPIWVYFDSYNHFPLLSGFWWGMYHVTSLAIDDIKSYVPYTMSSSNMLDPTLWLT